jgi:hypothetical protein
LHDFLRKIDPGDQREIIAADFEDGLAVHTEFFFPRLRVPPCCLIQFCGGNAAEAACTRGWLKIRGDNRDKKTCGATVSQRMARRTEFTDYLVL